MGISRKLLLIFLGALTLRLSLVFSAYHGDLNNNISWGTLAVDRGLNGFYDPPSQGFGGASWPYSAPNQPLLTILMFAVLRLTWQIIENVSWRLNNSILLFPSQFIWFWESRGMILLVKLPSILADLGIGWLIYKYFKDHKKEGVGFKLALVWLFNPITWYNSSIWGQTDSIVNLLGLASFSFLLKRKLPLSGLLFTLSLLFKGSLVIFSPVLVAIAIKQGYKLKDYLQTTFYILLTTILVSVWFHPNFDLPIWFLNLYKNRILPGEIGYLTANAFNFWWLVDPGKIFDSQVFLGLTARLWGFVITLGVLVFVIYLLTKKKISDSKIFLTLAVAALVSFIFMTRIHERYLYPFFPYATLLLGFIPSLWAPYIVLSTTHLLNLYHLFWLPPIPFLEVVLSKTYLPQVLAIINLITFVYLLRSTHQRL